MTRYFLLIGVILTVGVTHLWRHFVDYPVYEFAAQRLLKGEAFALYDLERTTSGGFYYPYFFALSFVPFAWLGFAGKLLFLFVLWGAYFYSLRTSLRLAGEPATGGAAVLTILLSLYSLNDALFTANIGVILLALCLGAFQWREQRPYLAGSLLGLAVVFKIYPLLIVCFFIWGHYWRVLLACLVFSSLTYFAIPVLFHGWETGTFLIRAQIEVLSHFNQHWSLTGDVFQNLPATVARWGGNYSVGLSLGCLFLFLVCAKSFFSRSRPDDLIVRIFILVLAFVPILTPVSWYNMGLFYLPLIAHEISYARKSSRKSAWLGAAAFALTYCLTAPDLIGSERSHRWAALGVPFLGVIILLGSYLRRLLKDYRAFILPGNS